MLFASSPSVTPVNVMFDERIVEISLFLMRSVILASCSPETFVALFGMMICRSTVSSFFMIADRSMLSSRMVFTPSSAVASPESVIVSGSIVYDTSLDVAPPPSMNLTSSWTSLYITTVSVTSMACTSIVSSLVSTASPFASTSV